MSNCALHLLLLVQTALPAAPQPTVQGFVPLRAENARDLSGDGRVFVELSSPLQAAFVQQRIPLRLRVGIEREFLREHMVQLFSRSLDIPVQVWFSLPAGAAATLRAAEDIAAQTAVLSADAQSFVFEETLARAVPLEEQSVGGRSFSVLSIDTRCTSTAPGPLVLPAPLVRFAFATQFERDFVNGRVAKDRVEAFVRGAALTLPIQALPEIGRPADFSGAVGRFRLRAEAPSKRIERTQIFALRLTIEGDGNLEAFDAPQLKELDGFQFLGMLETSSPTQRTFTYDLATGGEQPRQSISIPFSYFDPNPPAGYRTERSRPIEFEVVPSTRSLGTCGMVGRSHWPYGLGGLGLLVTIGVVWLIVKAVRLRMREHEDKSSH